MEEGDFYISLFSFLPFLLSPFTLPPRILLQSGRALQLVLHDREEVVPWRYEHAAFYKIALHPVFFAIHFDLSIRIFNGFHTIDHPLRFRVRPVSLRALLVGGACALPRLLTRELFG